MSLSPQSSCHCVAVPLCLSLAVSGTSDVKDYIILPFMPRALHQKITAIREMLANSGQADTSWKLLLLRTIQPGSLIPILKSLMRNSCVTSRKDGSRRATRNEPGPLCFGERTWNVMDVECLPYPRSFRKVIVEIDEHVGLLTAKLPRLPLN